MPAWPTSLLLFGANLLTARTGMRLRHVQAHVPAQRRVLAGLVAKLARASYWRGAGVEPGMDYEAFRGALPLCTHEHLLPQIERMVRGEADVLWPGACQLFSVTAGTTGGEGRLLPVTPDMQAHFRTASRDALLFYTARVGHAGVLHGRHLFLTGSTGLKPVGEGTSHRALVGEWPAIAAANLPGWLSSRLFEPGLDVENQRDWHAKLEAIVAKTAQVDVSLVAGMPPWVLSFAEVWREQAQAGGGATLRDAWPNLECYVHSGVPIGPYHAELRAALGPDVAFHEVYAAAEGVFAAQDTGASGQLRVLDRQGIFFEFLPVAETDAPLAAAAAKTVPLAEVKTGVDYVLVITTPAGLARYVTGDIVRFTSTEPPRFTYAGRTGLQLNAFEERVLERDLTEALLAVCQRHRWSIVNFHVAPLFGANLIGQTRGRHEWWVELRPGTVETPTGPQMATELDLELQRLNAGYAARRRDARVEAPTVRLVMPGVFRHWLKFHGRWGGQHKMARCRSDRLIADELAQITRFARD